MALLALKSQEKDVVLEKITAAFKASKARALALERDLHRHKALLAASGVTVAGYTLEQQQQNHSRQQQLQLQQQLQQQQQQQQQGLSLPKVKGATEAAAPSAISRAELRLPHAVILGPGDEHEFQREPNDRFVVGEYTVCYDLLLLPVAPSVSCSCSDPLNTRSSVLPPSPAVSLRLQLV